MLTSVTNRSWWMLLLQLLLSVQSVNSLSMTLPNYAPKGSAATPLSKKRIAVLGSGGYMGAMVFGFLQRASSRYETGIGSVRCIGATADTSVRLNRILSKHFALAVADESLVKLTNLNDVASIQTRLEGCHALILGNDWSVSKRPCTANTFETSPNDKTWEVYWDRLKSDTEESNTEHEVIKTKILENVLEAAKLAGIQHVVGVDRSSSSTELALNARLEQCGIPYTCILPAGQLVSIPDYSYRKGVIGQLRVQQQQQQQQGSTATSRSLGTIDQQIAREDIAALCVQSLQSLDWTTSRTLHVHCAKPLQVQAPVEKRPDQEWCVESRQVEAALAGIA